MIKTMTAPGEHLKVWLDEKLYMYKRFNICEKFKM